MRPTSLTDPQRAAALAPHAAANMPAADAHRSSRDDLHASSALVWAGHAVAGAAAGAVVAVPLGASTRLLARVLSEGLGAFTKGASPSLRTLALTAASQSLRDGALMGIMAGMGSALFSDGFEETREVAAATLFVAAASAVTASAGLVLGVATGESIAHVAAFVAPRQLHPHMLTALADGARIGLGLAGTFAGAAVPVGALLLSDGL